MPNQKSALGVGCGLFQTASTA